MAATGATFVAQSHHSHVYVEHRHVISAILWRLRTGAPWRDTPPRYGPWQTCYGRFFRWSRNGTWQRLLELMQAAADEAGLIDQDGTALDATHVIAHRSAAGTRKKISSAEKRGVVTAGQCSDATQIGPVPDAIYVPRPGRGWPRKRPACLRVDRAYGARHYRQQIQDCGMRCVCPRAVMRRGTDCAKGVEAEHHHVSMKWLTKAATSSSALSIG